MVKRIMALAFIIVCSSVAWEYLSSVMEDRTNEKSYAMSDAVGGLWGTEHSQAAPLVWIEWVVEKKEEMSEKEKHAYIKEKQEEENLKAKRQRRKARRVKVAEKEFIKTIKEPHSDSIELSGSDIRVDLDLEHRKKGLLWFSTYTVDFQADYKIENPVEHPVTVTMTFPFPSQSAVYDNLKVMAPGRDDLEYHAERNDQKNSDPVVASFTMDPNSSQAVKFMYQSRGLDQWTYRFGGNSEIIKDFKLSMTTNFEAIDFPRNSISPDRKEKLEDGPGWELVWEKESLVSAFQIGMVMPRLLNPGPLASAMSGHAPVSLLFFFFVIFLLQVLRGIKVHPMNYFFLAASFFAFNLLFSYLVDHVDIKLAFAVSSAVSILLVVSYLSRMAGIRFAFLGAGISQLIFQVMFSFAHFFEGYTGLSITVGAIFTLAVVMHMTARIDWEDKFKDSEWGGWRRRRNKAGIDSNLINSEVPEIT